MIGATLCRIGRHAPVAGGVWNGGYCFTRCARCDRDMVRSAFGEWHVPRDFRIVWGAEPAGDLDAVMEAREVSEAARPEAHASTGPHSPFDFSDFGERPAQALAPGPDEPNPRAAARKAGG